MKYQDRKQAGSVLASLLQDYKNRPDVVVLALPRGGVPVAFAISSQLGLELDVFIVRKLGVPGHEELAMGAIASGGLIELNEEMISYLQLEQPAIDAVVLSEQKELTRRELLYRGNKPFPNVFGKTIILVDDGVATGETMRAAILALQQNNPQDIIVAVPVAARSSCAAIEGLVKTLICPLRPVDFHAVGLWYDNFSQTADEEVIELLQQSRISLKQAGA